MKFFHNPPFVTPPKPSIATIGNFDGMHLGHQALLQELIHLAKSRAMPSTVIIFEPQPLEFFKGKAAPARLQRLSDKLAYLEKFGIDQVICLSFDQKLASVDPDVFVQELLINRFNISALLVGEDFCFGKNRAGNIETLNQFQQQGLLELIVMPTIAADDRRVSSTAVRASLWTGDFAEAARLLGRPYVITGKVMHGDKRGRLLNFPTANICLLRKRSPLHGVYAIRTQLAQGGWIPGVANIGVRPTVTQEDRWFLEAFLFTDKVLQLYTQRISVEFIKKIREEKRFNSLDELKAQIESDVIQAQSLFD